jgi:hypothetical protein
MRGRPIIVPHLGQDGRFVPIDAGVASWNLSMSLSCITWAEVRNPQGSTRRNLCGRACKSSRQLHISIRGANRTLRGVPLRPFYAGLDTFQSIFIHEKCSFHRTVMPPKPHGPPCRVVGAASIRKIERHDAVSLLKPTAVDKSAMLVQTARRDCPLRAKVRPRAAENQRARPR